MDAMTHAVEATTCRFANPVSVALAAQAIGLLFAWLPRAVADPAGDGAARGAVALASTLAGMAFGNADVTAVHCLSEAIGGLLDLPHGLLNATLLVPVLRHQRAAIAPPLAALAGSLGAPGGTVDEAAGAFLDRLTGLAADLAIPPFAGLGIDRGHHAAIAREAAANGSNPANRLPLDEAGYRALLAALG
jgi:alcohol dehydrogenase